MGGPGAGGPMQLVLVATTKKHKWYGGDLGQFTQSCPAYLMTKCSHNLCQLNVHIALSIPLQSLTDAWIALTCPNRNNFTVHC